MKLIGLMPCRNESWILGLSARAALMWVDQLIVADHWSTDSTRDIMNQIANEYGAERFLIRDWRDHDWTEMSQRQMLLDEARLQGATHIATIDADEVLTPTALLHMRGWVEAVPPGQILTAPWICLRDDIDTVMTTGLWGNATVTLAFKDDPAFHWQPQGPHAYDFHHRHPMGRPYVAHCAGFAFNEPDMGVMHLQFVSLRRLLAKQALYQATEVLRWPGRKPVDAVREMYARTVREAMAARVQTKPRGALWQPYEHLMQYLHVDAEPWQEAELRRLVAEHGRDKFKGLDLFGVA